MGAEILRIVLTGNSCFKIANFRDGLVRSFLREGHQVIVIAPYDEHASKLRALGCEVHNIHMDRNGTNILNESVLLFSIFFSILKIKPDVVYSYTIKNNIYFGLSCALVRIPFVPNVTGLGPAFNTTGILNFCVRFLFKLSFAKARMVFFQNPHDREVFLRARLVDAKNTLLLPGSGVNLDRFQAHPIPYTHEPGKVIFLLVSRLLWDKGIGLYAEAARCLKKDYPDIEFQLLGPLDLASRSAIPREQVDMWATNKTLTYLGEQRDVRPSMAAAHCIVLPSWYREGTPRTLLEAAAIGRPIITTDMPGCRDAIVNGVTGFLCAPQDLSSLVEAMKIFINLSPERREEIGDAARSYAVSHFDEQFIINAYVRTLPFLERETHTK